MLKHITYWLQITAMAAECIWQEIKGEEPDCPDCWKCTMMRMVLLCVITGGAVAILKAMIV